MKKYNKFLLIAGLALFMGCNDAIDIRQPGRLDALTAFESVADLQQGLFGVYNQLDVTPEIAFSANFTDEISRGQDNGGQGIALYNFNLNPGSTAASNFWVRGFRVNNRATIFIEAALGITPEPEDEQDYNNILGQAYAIRAFANLELLTYYSADLRDDSSLGIPVIDFVPALDLKPLRNTTGEGWAYIEDDITRANNLLTTQSSTTLFSRDALNALRARIAVTKGDYPTAATLAQQLLSAYPLANQVQYQLMFLDADNTEVIFKLERALNDSYDGQGSTGSVAAGGWAGASFAFVNPTIAGGSYFEMDRGIFNALSPNDVRFTVNVNPTSVVNPDYETDPEPGSTDILLINKYPGSEGQPLMNDLKVFRSSEMLLILAEARAAADQFGAAAQLIKQLRDARFGSPQPLPAFNTRQEAYAAILDERRIELAFEGFRYKDLKRLGVAANRNIDRDPTDCTIWTGACTLSSNDYRVRALPIPIVELNANNNIVGQQNPGY